MAITFTSTLTPGSTTVADAAWSDAAGFSATGPKLLIRAGDENQTISGSLDQSGASPACDLINILGGRPRIAGTSNAPLTVKFDNTYTTTPNLFWECDGGALFIAAATNACTEAVFSGSGEINLISGDFTTIVVDGPVVNVAAACDITTLAVVNRGSLTLEASSDTLPTLQQGGGYVNCKRRIETAIFLNGGRCVQYNTTGSGTAAMTINGGVYVPELGDVATITRNGGLIDIFAARGSLALGATAITNYGPNKFPSTTGLVTIGGGTTKDYAEFIGGAVAIPGGK
jgi:hypothetical protein